MKCIREWAAEYRRRGLAVCRLRPGEKTPTYRRWNCFSLSADDFGPSDSLGIIAGRLSGDIVCVDIDCTQALTEADRYLPGTGMEEGRLGKPRSHRWYKVVDIPAAWTATCAGGMGGPRTAQFARGRQHGDMVVECRGTGTQAVVPASVWTSKDGSKRERRVWHSFKEPAVLGYQELLTAVARFASAFDGRNSRWEDANRPPRRRRPSSLKKGAAPDLLPLPAGEAAQKARSYLRKVSAAVEGEAGDRQTFYAACLLVRDFGLAVEEALPLLLEWNERCAPPWPFEALVHKLEAAAAREGPRGSKLRPRSARSIEVNIRPGDREVLVGVDCAPAGASYINLLPDLWAGIVKHDHTFDLVPELDAIDWAGKVVVLATPSNVATNKKVVFDEFRLASLLRKRGAEARSLRIASPQGRRLTLAQAEEVEVITPPLTAHEAHAAAQAASRKAREQDTARRCHPRNKPSPALEKAVSWLSEQGAEGITKDLVKKAKRKGLSKRTLHRALKEIRQHKVST
ncbi:MAG TPA: hypothetical protein VH643_37755 [Gemmataceae bacterium]|jgi:hypothetical protein